MAPGAQEPCSAVSAEQTAPGMCSQAGTFLCGNAGENNPEGVHGVGGYFW